MGNPSVTQHRAQLSTVGRARRTDDAEGPLVHTDTSFPRSVPADPSHAPGMPTDALPWLRPEAEIMA